ncbi:uncharacterized protein LOC135479570 [Liolophura sinensis]|uniref:uncharacterized protein LOC135479570 n=1 Tax=Liolophura sinensis TaxID=3198878 RepID=UPI0031589F65
MMVQHCSQCDRYCTDLKKCSGCKTVFYCSVDCQREHWPRHKAHCRYKQPDGPIQSLDQVNQCCSNCKTYVGTLKRCTACKNTAYCSKSCQLEHWPEHKANCKLSSQDTSKDSMNGGRRCAYCNTNVGQLKSCTRCRTTAYCSKSCQLGHWPKHKANCKLSSQDTSKDSMNGGQRCAYCNTNVGQLKSCTRCRTTAYCSKSCQLGHWPKHKANCRRSPENAGKNSQNERHYCTNCNTVVEEVKRCTGCSAAAYCSKSCQKEHWPKHKGSCKWFSLDTSKDSTNQVQKCGNCNTTVGNLKKCVGCSAIAYCSKSCQQAHWPKHEINCGVRGKGKKVRQRREDDGRNVSPEPDPINATTFEGNTKFRIVQDLVSGSVMMDKQEPLPEFFLPPAPPPGPTELSRLVDSLMTSLPQPTFFDLADGQRFTFITNMTRVMPESYFSVLYENINTILVAKIVEMDVCWIRNGIRIMGDKSKILRIVHFHMPGMNPFPFFKWSDAVPGNYVCIRAPSFHSFKDGQVGFRINHASHVRILSASGQLTFGI